MQHLQNNFAGLALMIPYLAVGLAALWLSGRGLALAGMSVADQSASNLASGIRYAGVFLAIGIGLSGVFAGSSRGFLIDFPISLGYGAGLVVFTLVALKINDWFVLRGVDNSAEVTRGNIAVATVEFGGMIATGLVARGAVMGESGGWESALVFFALGQVAMVLLVLVYERIQASEYSLVNEVERGNVAAGVLLGGKLWAYGLIMSAAVDGGFKGWATDLTEFAVAAAAGMVFLYAAEWLVDRFIVLSHSAKESVLQGHVQSAIVLAAGKIGMAYVISTVAL